MMKLKTKKDSHSAITAIRDAASRLIEAGNPLWSLSELTLEKLSKRYPDCEFVSFHENIELVGGAVLYHNMPDYWPNDIADKPAVYISKLSIRTPFIGQNLSSLMLAKIENHNKEKFKFVRLDCDSEREKLNSVYLNYGFELIHHCVIADNYPTNFYEKIIQQEAVLNENNQSK